MGNTFKNLSVGQIQNLQTYSKREKQFNQVKMIGSKILFWLIIFFMIVVDVDASSSGPFYYLQGDTLDTDMDGIVNTLDLDDDNDGILDDDECVYQLAQIEWTHNEDNGQSQVASYTPNSEEYFMSAQSTSFGVGLDENSDNYAYTYLLRNADAATFQDAKNNDDYVEKSFVPSEALLLEAVNLEFYVGNAGDPEFNIGNFKIALEFSGEGGFGNPILLLQDLQVGSMIAGGTVRLPNDLSEENILLEEGISYVFRFYLYDEQNSDWLNRVQFNDVQILVNPLSTGDTDGDGLVDCLDADSDGDGCPDALEGERGFSHADIENGMLIGGIDENGVPLVATARGQAPGSSKDNTKSGLVCMTFAENDINQTPMNMNVSGNVLTNDADPTQDDQWVQSISALNEQGNMVLLPLGNISSYIYDENGILAGIISAYSNGTYDFNPEPSFTGTVPLSYLVEDTNGSTDAATFVIHVIPNIDPTSNHSPIAFDDTNTTEMDTDVTGNVITSNDYDLENEALTVSTILSDMNGNGLLDDALTVGASSIIYGANTIGESVMAGSVNLDTDGNYSFDPLVDFMGKVSLEYSITDENGGEDNATLTIIVLPNMDTQCFSNDDVSTGSMDEPQSGNFIINDYDPENDQLSLITAVDKNGESLEVDGTTENQLPSNGTIVLEEDGSFTYTPEAGFVGTEIVVYTFCNNNRHEYGCDTATLYLTTLPVNTVIMEFRRTTINQKFGSVTFSTPKDTNDVAIIRLDDSSFVDSDFAEGKTNEYMDDFILYPNPGLVGKDLLGLRFNSTNGKAHIQIADSYGRIVKKLVLETEVNQENMIQMDVTDLIEGSYYIQLFDGVNKFSKTFILMNEN